MPGLAVRSGSRTVRFSGWHLFTSSALLAGLLMTLSSCGLLPRGEAEAQPNRPGAEASGPAAVDVAIAKTGSLEDAPEYTGTTLPVREVSLRSQIEGRLLQLNVDVGDAVTQGDVLAQVDDALLVTAVLAEEAELAALRSEVVRAETQAAEVLTRVEQARIQQQQARIDANRLQSLLRDGAITRQQAELAETEAQSAAQVLRSVQEQVRTQRAAIAAAQERVAAQEAALAQAQERQSYALLTAPITGSVLERLTETGNLVQPGSEILKLGDFSQIKVAVQVSELDLEAIRSGQSVRVRLDAFPDQTIAGKVTRISPAADRTARLIPVEVTIPNPGRRFSSGLLARVSFSQRTAQRVIVPQSALVDRAGGRGGQAGQGGSSRSNQGNQGNQANQAKSANPRSSQTGQSKSNSEAPRQSKLFIVTGDEKEPTVTARSVTIGQQGDGQVEILSGLKPGERFVVRSSRPLQEGETVRLSILSEKQ